MQAADVRSPAPQEPGCEWETPTWCPPLLRARDASLRLCEQGSVSGGPRAPLHLPSHLEEWSGHMWLDTPPPPNPWGWHDRSLREPWEPLLNDPE